MSNYINSVSFYFLLPIYTALILLLIFFNIPENYYYGLYFLFTTITLPVLATMFILPGLKIRMHEYYQRMDSNSSYRYILLVLCSIIVLFGPIDIHLNGFKLLNPASYAEFNGVGRYVRHITILCWIFIPVAFIFVRSPLIRFFLIMYALVFPILIIDRNRLFLSFYSLFFCLCLNYNLSDQVKGKGWKRILFYMIPLLCILSFAFIGHFRSGSAFTVSSSGTLLHYNAYPLTQSFAKLPSLVQQIVLYITTPIFNFLTVASQNFINPDFLLSQFSPFSRENFSTYPYAPILIQRFNVGTEFYPFLLYGGMSMIVMPYLFLLISFLMALLLFKKYPNIFSFLIFIKISYSALFMGFAPQFYILLNLMFIVLMFFLWFCVYLLRELRLYINAHDPVI